MIGDGGIKTARMERAEGPEPSVQNLMPPQAQPSTAAPAPQPQANLAPQPQGQPPAEGGSPDGVNHFASNALLLLHSEESAPAYDDLIKQSVDGAAQAAVTIGEITQAEFDKRGIPVSAQEKGEALSDLIEDISAIGGHEPDVLMIKAIDKWSERHPEDGQAIAADFQELAANATPEEQEQGRIAAGKVQGGQPQAQPPGQTAVQPLA